MALNNEITILCGGQFEIISINVFMKLQCYHIKHLLVKYLPGNNVTHYLNKSSCSTYIHTNDTIKGVLRSFVFPYSFGANSVQLYPMTERMPELYRYTRIAAANSTRIAVKLVCSEVIDGEIARSGRE